jgi:protein-S-isoprenylcysteine O-methyltransferase Ste14
MKESAVADAEQEQEADEPIVEAPATETSAEAPTGYADQRPQMILSILFLVFYFGMVGSIFAVEVSDTLNMKKGENSLTGELQILFGVLTAGVGQVLSYWFNGQNRKA